MTVIDELVTLLGIELDDSAMEGIQKFQKGLDGIKNKVTLVSATLAAAGSAVAAFTVRMNANSAEMERFARLTGISSNVLQEFGFISEQAGGDFQSIQQDMMGLLTSMNSPIPGEYNQGLFMLGIGSRNAKGELKTMDEVLMDIARRMEGMTAQRQLQWGQKIGLSHDTIAMLQLGTVELEKLRQQARDIPTIVDPEDLKNARAFTQQISIITRFLRYLGQTAAASAGPALMKMTTLFLAWVKANKEWINLGLHKLVESVIEGFGRFILVIKGLKDWFTRTVSGIDPFLDRLKSINNYAGLVKGALIVIGVILAAWLWQWLAAAAAVLVLAAVVDDFIVGLQGGESVFGNFIKAFNQWVSNFWEQYPSLKSASTLIIDAIESVWEAMFTGDEAVFTKKGLASAFQFVLQLSKELLDNVFALMNLLAAFVGTPEDTFDSWRKNMGKALAAFKPITAFDGEDDPAFHTKVRVSGPFPDENTPKTDEAQKKVAELQYYQSKLSESFKTGGLSREEYAQELRNVAAELAALNAAPAPEHPSMNARRVPTAPPASANTAESRKKGLFPIQNPPTATQIPDTWETSVYNPLKNLKKGVAYVGSELENDNSTSPDKGTGRLKDDSKWAGIVSPLRQLAEKMVSTNQPMVVPSPVMHKTNNTTNAGGNTAIQQNTFHINVDGDSSSTAASIQNAIVKGAGPFLLNATFPGAVPVSQ